MIKTAQPIPKLQSIVKIIVVPLMVVIQKTHALLALVNVPALPIQQLIPNLAQLQRLVLSKLL